MTRASVRSSAIRSDRPTGCTPTDSHVHTYKRTDRDGAYVTNKSSLTDTCARVQDFDDLEMKR